jgi:hypothetical protein
VREGKEETLEELRRKFLQSQENAGHQARESRNEEVQQVEEAL